MVQAASGGFQNNADWNTFDIEVRQDCIRVSLNGHLLAEYEALIDRPKKGPIGLQLHDAKSIAMFRNVRILEVSPPRGPACPSSDLWL